MSMEVIGLLLGLGLGWILGAISVFALVIMAREKR